LMHFLNRMFFRALPSHSDMHGHANSQLTRERNIGRDHVHLTEFWTTRSHRECYKRIVRRQNVLPDSSNVLRVGQCAVVHPGFWIVTGLSVTENGTPTANTQSIDTCVGMFRRILDMRPVQKRRNTGVDCGQSAIKCGVIDILGGHAWGELYKKL